ncbi:hypothetical protein F4777DRAFT_84667 [Nemania sp. FL0916]|nr:hypothetical protein F4777DRAFT_84667 [Nemania sp. FL0916]
MSTFTEQQEPWYLKSRAPVLFPMHAGFSLDMPQSAFDDLVKGIVHAGSATQQDNAEQAKSEQSDGDDGLAVISEMSLQNTQGDSTQFEMIAATDTVSDQVSTIGSDEPNDGQNGHPFIQGLMFYDEQRPMPEGATLETERVPALSMENKMLTENDDIAYYSTTSSTLDLFTELEEVVSSPRLSQLLDAAWREDSLATLKIIFNARSIHLGKASRTVFYRCAGWLAQHHPLTLISNLRWLSRPIIQKKVDEKGTEGIDPEAVMVDVEPKMDVDDITRLDVKYGVSHGYWKDLLNILVLGVSGSLSVLADPNYILYTGNKGYVGMSQELAKIQRTTTRDERHKQATAAFNSDGVYKGLYLTIARLFAEQLKKDSSLLKGDDLRAKKNISLCAKWAPSHDRFHDKHTFIVSSIAEMLHPVADFPKGHDPMDRELYLRHAREEYRKDLSELRAHLDVVERKLSAKAYDKIEYKRVPSLAMNQYAKTFAEKDTERFEKYLDEVAAGKMSISGATLLPSTLIRTVMGQSTQLPSSRGLKLRQQKAAVAIKMQGLKTKVADGQWKTLVQRIQKSGTLESSIAVCDVSGSMTYPTFRDGTCPMDSAIGLSLLLAEVTAPPFGGHFITFSSQPQMQSIDLSMPLSDKVHRLRTAHWNMNTNLTAVFERLILPMAIRNKLSQEHMVKRVFVFSDMQFDDAEGQYGFPSSFERIQRSYRDAGYEMPQLIFWNLAGGRAGYGVGTDGNPTAPKPVIADEIGTAIVSGYSQSMLKVFLDTGLFEDGDEDDEDDEEVVKTAEEDDTVIVDPGMLAKKQRWDPMYTVRKAISHKAYEPLVIQD